MATIPNRGVRLFVVSFHLQENACLTRTNQGSMQQFFRDFDKPMGISSLIVLALLTLVIICSEIPRGNDLALSDFRKLESKIIQWVLYILPLVYQISHDKNFKCRSWRFLQINLGQVRFALHFNVTIVEDHC